MAIVRWNPMRDLMSVEREFNRIFNSLDRKLGFGESDRENEEFENAVWMPLTDILEDDNQYYLNIDLPGIKKEDVKINYTNGQLSISGERKMESEEKNTKYHRAERSYGKYYRSFTLPQKIKENEINAEFKDGQLKISIPKSEEAKPKQLEIKVK
ncbi:MAG: Hsp20/alpha crystallin family protein [Ignavibacteriaceae bacterium]|nr:Hsp20/alpha crystallin family protein [Ignavibacteriaceae bacterium]